MGAAAVADAVHAALLHARMRVPEFFSPWVMELLGADWLRACSSIPRRWLGEQAAQVAIGPVSR